MIARGAGGVRGCEREALLYVFIFIFLTGARCSKLTENYFMRERGFYFLPNFSGFIYSVFAVLLCRAVLSHSCSSTYSKHIKRGKKDYCPTSVMYT